MSLSLTSHTLRDKVLHFASKPQTTVSLKHMVVNGQTPSWKTSLAGFLSDELPIRFARKLKALEELPNNLGDSESIQVVKTWYAQSFEELTSFHRPGGAAAGAVLAQKEEFAETLHAIKTRHRPTVSTLAQGLQEWKSTSKRSRDDDPSVLPSSARQWLDKFHSSRIGIRFLIDQYLATHAPPNGILGTVHKNCNVHNVVYGAIEHARHVSEQRHGAGPAPPVDLICPEDLAFPYVPRHLNFITSEIVKNSLNAVMRNQPHGLPYAPSGSDSETAPVRVVVMKGKEDIVIKVSDNGGGLARSAMPTVWSYSGHGLPLSRLYARYFGGDLCLFSMEGYGTDVYIHLNRLADVREALN